MEKKNFILVTMDEVRPDRLSCYGYKKIDTPNIDYFANAGVRFETVISASGFTPISHGSILTGVFPNKHNLRDPFCGIEWKLVSETFANEGYLTAGFVGINLLGTANRFNTGFQTFDEPKHEEVWKRCVFEGDDRGELIWGNFWVPRMLSWIRANFERPFFIWAHYFDCHQSAEKILLELGKIEKDYLPEYGYYDPKIKYMDSCFFGPLRELIKELKIEGKTTLAITSDHGTNLGEHEVPPMPVLDLVYPQHVTMYDCDLLVPLIIKDRDLRRDSVIKGMARTVDIVPTLLDLGGIECDVEFDGVSLLTFIKEGKVRNLIAYSEEMYEKRGPGDFQAIRNDKNKYIVDHRSGKEEFYDLTADPGEQRNLVASLSDTQKILVDQWREMCRWYKTQRKAKYVLDEMNQSKIQERLQMLGYIE